MLKMKVANMTLPPIEPVQAAAPRGTCDITPEPHAEGHLQIIALDQLKAVEGVFRGEQIKSPDDLVAGDAFKLPKPEHQFRANCRDKTARDAVEMFTASKFGPSSFSATITHSVIFLSEMGQELSGYVLDGSRNAADRPSVVLHGEVRPGTSYILIEVTEGRKDLDWPDTAVSHSATPALASTKHLVKSRGAA